MNRVKDRVSSEKQYKPFITRWFLTTDLNISLPLIAAGSYDFIVDWGDGTSAPVTAYNDANASHTYSVSGAKTITINGKLTHWWRNSTDTKLTSVTNFGYTGIIDARNMFYSCQSLEYVDNDPNWSRNTVDMAYMFFGCSKFNSNISNWNTSSVTAINNMFQDCPVFNNGETSGSSGAPFYWNTGKVLNCSAMFWNAYSFNQPLDHLDFSKCEVFTVMFWGAKVFNQPVKNFLISYFTSAGNAADLFNGATLFNQPMPYFYTLNKTSLENLFLDTSFNQDISMWDMTNVNDLFGFLLGTPFSTTNYDNLLNAWSQQSLQVDVQMDVNATYSAAASAARAVLTNPVSAGGYNWTVTDLGPA